MRLIDGFAFMAASCLRRPRMRIGCRAGITDEAFGRPLPLCGHHQRGQRQFGSHVVTHRPADDLAVVRSSTAARYSHPCPVAMKVMSASQMRFGADATHSCFNRFGAMGREWLLSVVHGLNLRPASARIP